MTNEEIKQALFEAFSAGNYRVNNAIPVGALQERFGEFIKAKYPQVLEPTVYKHFDIMCECDEHTPYDKEKGCCCYD